MSAASELRSIAFTTLADPDTGSGETVTFRDEPVDAVVKYDPQPETPSEGMQQFTDRGTSVVEIAKALVSPAPEVGEEFTGPDGRRHRVRLKPRTTDLTYVCDCTVSTPVDAS